MDRIAMTYQEVESAANEFNTCSGEADQLVARLNNLVQTISSTWIGDAYQAFQREFTDISPRLRHFSEVCGEVSNQLRQAASQMQQADASVAGYFRAGS